MQFYKTRLNQYETLFFNKADIYSDVFILANCAKLYYILRFESMYFYMDIKVYITFTYYILYLRVHITYYVYVYILHITFQVNVPLYGYIYVATWSYFSFYN